MNDAMRKVEVLQPDASWLGVSSLLDVRTDDVFRMTEPGETEPGDSWVATCNGYLNDTLIPIIECVSYEPIEGAGPGERVL